MNAPGVRLNSRHGACCGAVIPVPSAVADGHAERVLENLCAFCLQPFEPMRPHQRFCGRHVERRISINVGSADRICSWRVRMRLNQPSLTTG